MNAIVQLLMGIFGKGAGQAVGNSLANAAALAALAPVALWFLANKDAEAVSFTWGELAVFGLFAFALVKVAHYSRPKGSPWIEPRE